jgi:50S ribosomal protein L16 3-hydroxylase
LASGEAVLRNPASRFSFMRMAAKSVLLFADGECFECTGECAVLTEMLCAQEHFIVDPALIGSDAGIAVLEQLFAQGSIAFADEE